uniref:Peptidase S1 domain-containing protein n=1 Tax=Daphnia galeata TaxID=27404 RepID=A0A8J2RYB7_9CRUS|nr:unnamed protein product [Daphnia galeata]
MSYINGVAYNQVGIRSLSSALALPPDAKSVYTRVSYYAEWISSVTGLKECGRKWRSIRVCDVSVLSVITLKILAAVFLLVAFVCAQALARDLVRYKPRGVLFPRPPSKNKKPIFPVKHTATINTGSFYGRENSTSSRIVGGTEAEPNSLPW